MSASRNLIIPISNRFAMLGAVGALTCTLTVAPAVASAAENGNDANEASADIAAVVLSDGDTTLENADESGSAADIQSLENQAEEAIEEKTALNALSTSSDGNVAASEDPASPRILAAPLRDEARADYNAAFAGSTTDVSAVNVSESGDILEDSDVTGTLTYAFKQSDLLDGIVSTLRIYSSFYGEAYTILDNNNYVDIVVTLPEGFSGTFSDASTGSILNTKLISNDDNSLVVRVYITGGADPSTRTIKETIASYQSDSRDSVVSFVVQYAGKALAGTSSNDYEAVLPYSMRTVTYGRWANASVGLSSDPISLLSNQTVIPDVPTAQDVLTEGDISIGENTQHDAVFEATAGDTYAFTGSYTTFAVKEEISKLAGERATQAEKETVLLSDLASTFRSTFTLPEGMSFFIVPTIDNVVFTGGADTFRLASVNVSGQTIEIIMDLVAGEITNFYQLEQAVYACDDVLKVVVPGIKVSESVDSDSLLTVIGTAGGFFSSNVYSQGVTGLFEFEWEAQQSDEGRDSILGDDDKTISFTLKTVDADDPVVPDDPSDDPTDPVDPADPGDKDQDNVSPRHENFSAIQGSVLPSTSDSASPVANLLASALMALGFVGLFARHKKNAKHWRLFSRIL